MKPKMPPMPKGAAKNAPKPMMPPAPTGAPPGMPMMKKGGRVKRGR